MFFCSVHRWDLSARALGCDINFDIDVIDCVDRNKLWKILKEMEYQTTWPASWETCMQVRKQQLELGVE